LQNTQEFTENCVQLVRALAQGLVVPLNPMEPTESHVFVYNNIFVSQAVDSKESFKLYTGDAATRKTAGHDIKNQKILQIMNVDGLSHTLSLIVDYRGLRYICQSIIPGVLTGSSQSGGSNHARLVYGLMDHNKRVSVKTQAFAVMQSIGKKLRIPTRNLPATPVLVSDEFIKEHSPTTFAEASLGLESPRDPDSVWRVTDGGEESLKPESPSSIRVDDVDEIAPADAVAVPHVGPIEAKLIEGSDGRLYCLEMVSIFFINHLFATFPTSFYSFLIFIFNIFLSIN